MQKYTKYYGFLYASVLYTMYVLLTLRFTFLVLIPFSVSYCHRQLLIGRPRLVFSFHCQTRSDDWLTFILSSYHIHYMNSSSFHDTFTLWIKWYHYCFMSHSWHHLLCKYHNYLFIIPNSSIPMYEICLLQLYIYTDLSRINRIVQFRKRMYLHMKEKMFIIINYSCTLGLVRNKKCLPLVSLTEIK